MPGARSRISLVEYGKPIDLFKELACIAGLERARSIQLLLDAGLRAANCLGFSKNPIIIDANGIRAIDFAGLIRLGPSLELEVAPKFLGLDEEDNLWREDFFFLSTLSRHGRLLASEGLSASGGASTDLSTLVARSLTTMYDTHKRRPLRSYRRIKELDFFIDGDLDPTDFMFPGPDGFAQEVIQFSRQNTWNSTMSAAASELLPEVRDPAAAAGLVRMIGELAPQHWKGVRGRKPIPSRHRSWSPVYELSIDVLTGLGMNYMKGYVRAPGYLISTWQLWEDLLTIGARLGFGKSVVLSQKGFELGAKKKAPTMHKSSPFFVYPDCIIESEGHRPRMILDAKYKGHVEKGQSRIVESDIYEALAFSKAANCKHVVLAYPALPKANIFPPGTCAVFEKVEVDQTCILGVQIETRKISRRGALNLFAANLSQQLTKHLLD